MRSWPLAISLCVLVGCSSSADDNLSRPSVAGAAFVGAGSTPTAGDTLTLLLSRDVTVTAAVLDDTDVILSSGSLGAITTAPTLVNSRAVQITLGAGTTFTPGTTTIAFSDTNDSVRTSAGLYARGGTQTITVGDGDVPTVVNLTLNDIPDILNGEGAAGGSLQVPRSGFTIDVEYTDPTSAIAPASTQLSANVVVRTPLGELPAGTNFAGLLTRTETTVKASFLVTPQIIFPEGSVQLTAVIVDATGMSSTPTKFNYLAKTAADGIRPLEAGQMWRIVTSRDLESYTYSGVNPEPVAVVAGANGTPDLEDLFALIGIYGNDPAVNTTVMAQFQSAVLTRLGELYPNVNVTFQFAEQGVFPGGAILIPYADFAFSQICIAGSADTTGTSGTLGLASFDPRNSFQDDDCSINAGGARLGVFLHTFINTGMKPPSSSTFRVTYGPLSASLGGTPIGNDAQDAARLAGTLTDGRTTTITNAINRIAIAATTVTAHEIGHSLGLVQDGAMPAGLYGDDTTNFPGSTSGHIDNSALYPGNAQNVMSPFINFDSAINSANEFNLLNLAYLRERALYN